MVKHQGGGAQLRAQRNGQGPTEKRREIGLPETVQARAQQQNRRQGHEGKLEGQIEGVVGLNQEQHTRGEPQEVQRRELPVQ